MKLKKLTLNNIRSYEDLELEFPEGSLLLSGDIGSGKTSVLLAIEFALFGLQPGQRGSSLLRNGAQNGGVKIVLEIDEKEIEIERTLKRNKSISQDYAAIKIDDEKKETSVTELKNKVLELLNYPGEFSKKQNILYKFTVYTPQEEMKQIILQDSETRLNTLRHVFGIDKYKKILENTSILLSKVREEIRGKEALTSNLEEDKQNLEEKEKHLETKRNKVMPLKNELEEKSKIRKEIEQKKEEISGKIKERDRLKQEIEKTKIMISTKKDSASNNVKEMQRIDKEIKELESMHFDDSKIQELNDRISRLNKRKSELNQKGLEINTNINSLNMKNNENLRIVEKLKHIEVCPTCLQDVNTSYKENVLKKFNSENESNKLRIQKLDSENKEIKHEIESIEKSKESCEKELQDLRILKIKLESIKEKKNRISEIKESNEKLEKDIEFLNNQIETLNSSVIEYSKYDNLFEQKSKELQDALNNEKTIEIKLAELKTEIEMSSKQMFELKTRIEKTESIKKELFYLKNLESWLVNKFSPMISFVERNVMIKLKSEFSKLFAKWFNMLVPENFNVTLDDSFTPILEQQDYEIDYAYLSGGERTAVALAYRLALNQVINSILSKIKTHDIVILDEPTDGFSDQQLDKMREIFNELQVAQLIIVSHEQKIESFVDNVIKFRKNNNRSYIEK